MLRVDKLPDGVCYFNNRHRKWVALDMLSSSYTIFFDSVLIQRLDLLKEAFDTASPDEKGLLKKYAVISEIMRNPILDAIKIITCFENFFKAELLLKGYVIHRIVCNKRYAIFSKHQEKTPIRISDIKRAEGLLGKKKINYVFKSLNETTIIFSIFLNRRGYQSILKFPQRLYDILKDINEKRNTLHYLAGQSAAYNKKIIDDYIFLRDFVKKHLVKRHNNLVKELEFPDNHLIKN